MKRFTAIFAMLLTGLTLLSGCSSTPPKDAVNMKKASDINVQLGAGYIQRGDYKTARIKLQRALEQNPDNALAHSTMALLLEKVGKYDEVEDYYEDAISLDKENSDIKNNFGAFLCNRGRYEDANEQFEKAINDPYYSTPGLALVNAGKCAYKQKDFKKAEAYYRRALRINANDKSALYHMGQLGLDTHRYLMTRAYMQRYHSVVSPSPNSLWIQIQAEKALGDEKYTKQLINKLVKRFPDSNEAGKAMGLYR